MQTSLLHDLVDVYQNTIPISSNYYCFRGGRSTRRTSGGATGEVEVAHGQEKLNFVIQRMEERGHQKKVNCVDPPGTSDAKPSWLKLVLSLFKYD